jgi:hypothetical protein
MRRNTLNKLFVICGLLAIVSCKAKKQMLVNKAAKDTMVVKSPALMSRLNSIRAAQLNFNTFSGKAKTQITLNGSGNNVTMNVRIEKGKRIWVSVTAIIGIEVARAVITPDSILVINKLQSLYLRQPFSYIYKYASEKLDYSSVEALMIGNAIPQLLDEKAALKTDTADTRITGALDNMVYDLVVGADLKAKATDLSNPAEAQELHVNNSAPLQAGDRTLPSQIDINSVVGNKKVKISLHYNKVEFDKPLEYPFSIPEDYTPAK